MFLSLWASHFPRANLSLGVLSFQFSFKFIHLGVLNNFGSHGFASPQLRKGMVWIFWLTWIEMQVWNPISNSIPSLTWKCVKTSALFSSLPNLFYYQKKNMYTGHCNSYWSLVSFTYSPSGWLHRLACFGNQQAVTIQGRNLLYFIYVKWYFLVHLWMTWQKETYANLSYMICPNKHLNTVFHLAFWRQAG